MPEKQKYLGKPTDYEDYVSRPPAVKVWRNDTKRNKFIGRAMWNGKQSPRNRVIPGDYHVIDDQRGERSFTKEELDLLYTKKPGRKPSAAKDDKPTKTESNA